MQIIVGYATQIRSLTGVDREAYELGETESLSGLLEMVCERHGPEVRELLIDDVGAIRSPLFICVNDAHVLDPADRNLAEGDQVLIMSAMSGG